MRDDPRAHREEPDARPMSVPSANRAQADIYETRARDYHRLVSAEDCEKRLLPAIASRVALAGQRVIEVGAGTGRVTRMLVEAGADVRAYERAAPMLEVAREQLPDVCFELADARALPAQSASADLVVAGWVFGHLRMWMPDGWQAEVGACLAEAERVLAAGGHIVILETLGTGRTAAAPPSPALAEYYAFLEAHGFVRSDVATDYQFGTVDEAAEVLGGFFGPDMADRIRREQWARVPEWTGIWVR